LTHDAARNKQWFILTYHYIHKILTQNDVISQISCCFLPWYHMSAKCQVDCIMVRTTWFHSIEMVLYWSCIHTAFTLMVNSSHSFLKTKYHSQMVSILVSYSASFVTKVWPAECLSWQVCYAFLGISRQILEYRHKLGHAMISSFQILSNSLFIYCPIIWQYIVLSAESVIKLF
jgi:hypothetical protein